MLWYDCGSSLLRFDRDAEKSWREDDILWFGLPGIISMMHETVWIQIVKKRLHQKDDVHDAAGVAMHTHESKTRGPSGRSDAVLTGQHGHRHTRTTHSFAIFPDGVAVSCVHVLPWRRHRERECIDASWFPFVSG